MGQRQKTFDEQVMKMTRCHIWIGRRDPDGYGKYRYKGREIRAARYALERSLGRELSPGMQACHHCDNPPCVNPGCLYEGTPKQNAQDKMRRGRYILDPPPITKPYKVVGDVEETILQLRTQGLTQANIGNLVGISQGHVSRVLRRNGIQVFKRRRAS